VVALVASRAAMPIRWIATFGMVAASVKTMLGEAHRADAFALRVREDVRVATQLAASGELIVTRLRDTLYPVLQERRISTRTRRLWIPRRSTPPTRSSQSSATSGASTIGSTDSGTS